MVVMEKVRMMVSIIYIIGGRFFSKSSLNITYYYLENVLGRCCGGGCGGYVGGKSALDHYHDGLFGNPKVTTWTRGQPAEVYWQSGARHRGGYAYRLCKVNNGKIWKVTEECFQKGHLDFSGIMCIAYKSAKIFIIGLF